MTLFGDNLSSLFKQCNNEFSVGTQVRLGMQVLYGLKQLHDHGYIHRDIKPSNLAVGKNGLKARIVHLLDFGLVRKFIRQTNGKLEMRRPREAILFRGTTKWVLSLSFGIIFELFRYCSASMHLRSEQGRSDDLWSMVNMLIVLDDSIFLFVGIHAGRNAWIFAVESVEVSLKTNSFELCNNFQK